MNRSDVEPFCWLPLSHSRSRGGARPMKPRHPPRSQPVGAAAPADRPAGQPGATRMEHDLLGEKEVPADAYYGVQTARALENFQISGVPINHYPGFIEAWAIVKLAAARGNTDVGAMKKEKLAAIEKAATGSDGGQVPRPVPGRLVPGRRRHVHQHERQRSAGERGAGAERAPEGRVQHRRAARRPEPCRNRPTTPTRPPSRWRSSCATTS